MQQASANLSGLLVPGNGPWESDYSTSGLVGLSTGPLLWQQPPSAELQAGGVAQIASTGRMHLGQNAPVSRLSAVSRLINLPLPTIPQLDMAVAGSVHANGLSFEDSGELSLLSTQFEKPKAKACIPCRQLKKKCESVRPCRSCLMRGCAEDCKDDAKALACALCRRLGATAVGKGLYAVILQSFCVLTGEPACSRRLKCDRQQPCSRCVQLGVAHECRPKTSTDEALSSLKTLLSRLDSHVSSQNADGVLAGGVKRTGSAQDDSGEASVAGKRSRWFICVSVSLPVQVSSQAGVRTRTLLTCHSVTLNSKPTHPNPTPNLKTVNPCISLPVTHALPRACTDARLLRLRAGMVPAMMDRLKCRASCPSSKN